MDLNTQRLLGELEDNTQEILHKIANDPLLVKRTCALTGLTIANADKALFTPKNKYQQYAKGIIYRHRSDGEFELVGLPYLKMKNFDEDDSVRKHVAEMIEINAEMTFFEKKDGTLISMNIVDDRMILSTRGMMETLPSIGAEGEDSGNKFFDWAYKIIDEKYKILRERRLFKDLTLIFELVGPENRIITFYPEWDLVLTGVYDKIYFRYYNAKELKYFAEFYNLKTPLIYTPKGNNLAEQIQSLNNELINTDKEGTVIQFEKNREVVGRVKAKSDTYRTLLRISMNCNYKTIAEILKKHPELNEWGALENHIKELGRHKFPEELMEAYHLFYQEYIEHRDRCEQFIGMVMAICDHAFRKIGVKDYTKGLNSKQRKEFAGLISQRKSPKFIAAAFAFLDNYLTLEYTMEKLLITPKESAELVRNM